MTVRTKFGACILLGCSLAVSGCAQPSLWSQFSGPKVLGSPNYRSAPNAASNYSGRRPVAQQPQPAENEGESLVDSLESPQGRSPGRMPVAKAPSNRSLAAGTKRKGKETDEFSDTEFAQMSRARLSEKKFRPEDAERLYIEVLKKNPQNADAWHRLGVVSATKGNFKEAEQCFAKHEELAAPTSECLNNKGYCLYLQHRLPEAEALLREATAKDTENDSAMNNLGLVLGAQEKFDDALVCFKKAGTDAQAYANLAYVYTQMGELEHAEAHYSHALTLDKKLKSAANAMVQVHEKRRHLSTKAPPTSLAERPNLEGTETEMAEVEAPPARSRKSAEADLLLDEESEAPVRATAPLASRKPLTRVAQPAVANEPYLEAEAATELPFDEIPLLPKSYRATELTAKAAMKPALPPAAEMVDDGVATLQHEQAAESEVRVDAVQAVNEDDAADSDLPPVLTADQYKVRRTSAELPFNYPAKKPSSVSPAKGPRYNYGAPSELAPKAASRKLSELFPAP